MADGGGISLNLNTKVFPFLKNLVKITGENRKKVEKWTIETLLTHRSGFSHMMMSAKQLQGENLDNLLQKIFETKIENKPNSVVVYNNVEPFLLSVIFQEVTGENLAEFCAREIFKPLEIEHFEWKNYGKYCAGCTGLFLNFRDFHKIGRLLMDGGKFLGKQIVPRKFMEKMTKMQVETPNLFKPERVFPKVAVGFFVFISKNGVVFRDGSQGQYVICDRLNNMLLTIMSTENDMARVTEICRGVFPLSH